MAEEFNKYLSYVRNLGFEDTPDYDYLRELFTQALKNTGEVEDGEYDWMKLNNGKGWEAMKHHGPTHLHPANAGPNTSTAGHIGRGNTPQGTGTPVGPARLNAPQPLPPTPKPGANKQQSGRPNVSGTQLPKRQSGAAGGLNDAMQTPSTQGQFPNSTTHLPQRINQANPGMNPISAAQAGSRPQNGEQQPSAFQKVMKALCCSR